MAVNAACPTDGPTVIEVCNDAGGNGTIRAYFYDGDPGISYFLFSLTTGQYVSDPLGPVTVNTGISLPPTAVAGVEFGGVPDGDYVIRVNCSPSGTVVIGGLGINVNSADALAASVSVAPDCNPLTGGVNAQGSITLSISGGTAPYDITWPTAVTPISDTNNAPAGNHTFPNLDGGAYTVVITDASNCVFTTNINVPVATLPNAGPDQTVCGFSASLSANAPGAGEAGTWTGPAGVTFTPNANAPNAVASNLAVGANTLTWTITDTNGVCASQSDAVIITSDDPATANAGPDQTICAGSTVSLNGVITGTASSVTWTGGGGIFSPNNTSLTPVYTPTAAELSAGTVTLTMTTDDPAGPCQAVSDNIVITINPAATANAGTDQTICADGSATLNGSFAGSAVSASWSGGTGTFTPDNSTMSAVYTPSAAEIAAGSVTLTLTTNDPDGAGPCVAATDDVLITINAVGTANAGADQTICAGGTVNLSGSIGGSASTATWTGGTGTFSPDPNALNAVYTPGAADIAAGTVTLTLTASGPCAPVSDDIVITINPVATVNAGPDQTICAGGTAALSGSFTVATTATWSGGAGTFAPGNTDLNATYTPTAAEIASGSVTLTLTTDDPDGAGPCTAVSDNVTITISPLGTADAGADQTICPDEPVNLSGTIGGSATTGTWTGGAGTFAPNNTTLITVYTPTAAEIAAGTVTLTLTATGSCAPVSDDITIAIRQPSIVNAGTDQAICAGSDVTLSGSVGGSALSGTWSGGAGLFTPDNTTLTATYTPTAAEVAAGSVTLTLTTTGPCTAASDDVVITIRGPATANAGADQAICEGNTVALNGSIGGSALSATWSGGAGTFSPDNATLNAVYTPTAAEVSAGTVTLTLTTSGPCAAVSDDVIITIEPAPAVNAGADRLICSADVVPLSGSSVGGSATTGAWSIANQPAGGDGVLSDLSQTATPSAVTFTATVAGTYTLRLTTDDPAGVCSSASDDVIITVVASATVNAGNDQTICVGGTATLAGAFTGSTGITWSTSGDGSFNDPSLTNAVYTPGANDISGGTVTLALTTAGPCASVSDNLVLTIVAAPTVDAGVPQTICSNASIVLNASFGGSATGLLWSSSGDGTFSDNTDPNASYTPGAADATNGTVTLTATATGSCPGTTDDVVITVNPAATIDAGSPQTICFGFTVTLNAVLGGSATTLTWTTSGDGTFNNVNDPAAVYTPGANDQANGTVTLMATTNNPAGPCPAANDNVVITLRAIPGDETTAGNETWMGYVYDDSGDPTPIPAKIDFNTAKYRGFIDAADIDNMSASSTYNVATDAFDLNPGLTLPVQGTNVCGSYLNFFSIRYKMNKTFAAGIYRFTVGADDGIRLLIDGVNVLPASAFDFQSYTTYTSQPVCLTAGVHALEIHYFDNTAQSRLTFDYEAVPPLTTITPVAVCVNSAAPTLTASSIDADVIDFNWYKNGTLVFTGASYTPAGTELDMTTAASTTFQTTAIYACGETPRTDVVVNVVNLASLLITPQVICESGGVVDLRNFVDESPPGGTFVFSGHANISGNNFDPSGLTGTTVSITVEYTVGSCTAPQGTLELSITDTAVINTPSSPVAVCEGSPGVDLKTLVSATPSGGTFSFSGTQVTGDIFDPSGLSGIQTITVDYSVGCIAPSATFEINVTSIASLTTSNTSSCENGADVNLLTLASATPSGGTFTFTGPNVSGTTFDPSGLSGTITLTVNYDINGCTDNRALQITVLAPGDPLCSGGTCAGVVVVPKPEPASCTNSDGRLVMSLKPFTPAINNTGVRITIDGMSSTNLPISRTIFNDSVFNNLPVGRYDYTIEYGDPSCIKAGQFSIDQSGTVGTPVVSNISSPLCPGSATGSLTLDVPGETGNILEWSLDGGLSDPFKPFTAGAQISGIPAGPPPSFQQVISVRRNISDVCYSSVTVVIAEAVPDISVTFDITPATCNGYDGAITNIVASGGNDAPYTFSINGGQSFQSATSFSGLSGGAYTLRVRDAAGCEKDFSVNVTFPGFINTAISKTNANCTNNGSSGSISVIIDDPGVFVVAVTTDLFNAPADSEYQSYINPSIVFNGLPRGEYYVYAKSNGAACPTRSAPINIFGVYPVSFDVQPDCNGNELSIALVNVAGDPAGASLDIEVTKKLSADPPETISQPFPANGEIYLDYSQHAFLKAPGEYQIRIIQFQNEVGCNLSSQTVDITVPQPLSAQIGFVSKSYPDIPTGELQVTGFSGGIYPYDVRIELDSASSFALPEYLADFEPAGLNQNQEVEMLYKDVPPGRYDVQVMDSVGCIVNLTARVPLDEEIFIPNVFTPNGDGSNDVFFIRNLPRETSITQLIISNRWGKEVFASENYQNNWDGDGAADGIYFYRLQIKGDDALTGWVEIIRGSKP